MTDEKQTTPRKGKLQPLSYMPVNPAKVMLAEGMSEASTSPTLFGAVWLIALSTWIHGPMDEGRARRRFGETAVDELLEMGAITTTPDGLTVSWVEEARTDMDTIRATYEARARKAAAARWGKNATSIDKHSSSMLADARRGEKRREERERSTSSSATPPQMLQSSQAPTAESVHEATPEKAKPTRKAKKEAAAERAAERKKGDHVQLIETFQRAWAYNRCGDVLEAEGFEIARDTDPKTIPAGARYIATEGDWKAAAALWKAIDGDMATVRGRMKNFFASEAEWVRTGGFSLFASKFSVLIEPINPLANSKERS